MWTGQIYIDLLAWCYRSVKSFAVGFGSCWRGILENQLPNIISFLLVSLPWPQSAQPQFRNLIWWHILWMINDQDGTESSINAKMIYLFKTVSGMSVLWMTIQLKKWITSRLVEICKTRMTPSIWKVILILFIVLGIYCRLLVYVWTVY